MMRAVLFQQCRQNRIVALVENLLTLNYVLDICLLFRYCVFAKIRMEEATMTNQLPVKRCQHCGGEDFRVGWQSDALVTFKRNGLLGNRIKFLICGNCGAILYQCVAEPHRFPQAR